MKEARMPKRVLGRGRTRVIVAASIVVLGAAVVASAALGTATRPGRAADAGDMSVVGSWHVTVRVDGAATSFDTLYVFNRDGGGLRIDGRNNAPGVVEWAPDTENRAAMTVVLFSFDATGHRVGTITSHQLGWVRDGVLHGTFSATGVDLAGNTLPGFPKTGTFTGDRIEAQAP